MSKFIITEEEINTVVNYLAAKPLAEAMAPYQVMVKVAQSPIPEEEGGEDLAAKPELKKAK